MINKIFINDFIVWIQQTPDSQFEEILSQISKLHIYPTDLSGLDKSEVITKEEIGLKLDEIDKFAAD